MDTLRRLPCEFTKVGEFYRVKLYLLIEDDFSIHAFLHSNDWKDNAMLARDLGISTYFKVIDIVVSPTSFPKLYDNIVEYVHQTCISEESQ